MANKRRRVKSPKYPVGVFIAVIVIALIASIPKQVWGVLGALAVIAFGAWIISRAFEAPSSNTTVGIKSANLAVTKPKSPDKPKNPSDLTFSLDEVEYLDKRSDPLHKKHTDLIAVSAQSTDGFFSLSLGADPEQVHRIPSAPPDLIGSGVRWIPASEIVEIAGEKIIGGFVYLGSERKISYEMSEPSLINPKLKVSNGIIDISERLTSYWPSYSQMSPEARRAYLQWLSSGRKAPHANIGYVFLFFYGLERRVFIDAKQDPRAADDVPRIINEVERLLDIYGGNNSFRSYATQFIEFLRLGDVRSLLYQDPPPSLAPYKKEMSMKLRVGLGQLAADKQPLSVEWALAWVMSDPNILKRTPVARCGAAFDKLFSQRYTEAHGAGLLLPQNKTVLRIVYRTASAALPVQDVGGIANLPDITATSSVRKKLQLLVDSCADQLEPYSRYLGRNPSATDALEGLLQLPVSLWPVATQNELAEIKRRIGDGMLVMSFRELSSRLRGTGDLSRDKVLALARAFQSLHIGLEPNVLGGGRTPKPEDNVVLFAEPSEEGSRNTTAEYYAASITLDLACAVAAADGNTSAQEIMMLSKHVDSWGHLSLASRKRLKAHLRLQLKQPPSLQSLKKKLEPLEPSTKRTLATFLTHLAQADGEVSPDEVKLLERVYKTLELEPQSLYTDLHVASSDPSPQQTAHSQREVVAQSTSSDFILDHDRITRLKRETEHVTALLAQVFIEDVQDPQELSVSEEITDASSVWGLGPDLSAFLRVLISRPEWARDDLSVVAKDMEVMLDGALEQINEVAFDQFDMPVTEGEDPLEINPEIMEKLSL